MFNFLHQSKPRHPTIRQALAQLGVVDAGDSTRVAVLEKHGQYAGRRVNFFRAFEAGHEDLELGSGHVESDGVVVVDSLRASEKSAPPAREPANRAVHNDDERLVFWDADAAR